MQSYRKVLLCCCYCYDDDNDDNDDDDGSGGGTSSFSVMAAGLIAHAYFAPVEVLSSAFPSSFAPQSVSSVHVIGHFASSLNKINRAIAQHLVVSISPTVWPVHPETAGVVRGFIHALESQATAHRLRLQLCRTEMQRLASVTEPGTIRQVNETAHSTIAYLNPLYYSMCLRLIFPKIYIKKHASVSFWQFVSECL